MAGIWEVVGGVRTNPLTIRGEEVPPNVGPLVVRKLLPDGTVTPPPTASATVFGSSAPTYAGGVAGVRAAFGTLPCQRLYNLSAMPPAGSSDRTPSYYGEIDPGFTQTQADAAVVQIRDATAAGKTSFITNGHENDQGSKGQAVADYNADVLRLCNAVTRLGQGKVRVAPIGRGFLLRTPTGPSNWIAAHWTTAVSAALTAIDPVSGKQVGIVAFDLYNGKSASQDLTPAQLYGDLASMAASLGVGWGTAESAYATYYGSGTGSTTAHVGNRADTTGGTGNNGLAGYWTSVDNYLKALANPPAVFLYWQSDNQAANGPTFPANGYVLQRTTFASGQITTAYPQACAAMSNMFARSA